VRKGTGRSALDTMKPKRTLTCPNCDHENIYAPERWIDFGNWVRGYPTHIACGRCGAEIALPGRREPFASPGFLLLTLLFTIAGVTLVSLGILVFKLLGG
jgi:hypothetical protein